MRQLIGVLREELKNSLTLQQRYKEEIARLPKGSLIAKTIKGHRYYYIAQRNKEKVVYKYLGKLSLGKIKELRMIRIKRRQYKKLLLRTISQIEFLKNALSYGTKAI